MGQHVGIDGCRFGWVSVSEDGNALTYRMHRTIRELLASYPQAAYLLVDIPIGLPWKNCPIRPCDAEARRIPGARRSSVFPVPCRHATRATNIEDARRLNCDELDRSLSAQSWAICKKIAEVDEVLLSDLEARRKLREIHPEVCFWALNERQPLRHPKSSRGGLEERLSLLIRHVADARALVDAAMSKQLRRDLKADDVLDALAAFVVARAMPNQTETLQGSPSTDEKGLPMEMLYANPAADGVTRSPGGGPASMYSRGKAP